MRKLFHTLGFLAFLAAGVSCNKEAPGPAGDGGDRLCTVSFVLNPEDGTKAVNTGSLADGSVNRVDIFEYDTDRYLTQHYTLTAEELSSRSFHLQYPYGTIRGYVVLANLSPGIVDIIETVGTLYGIDGRRFLWGDLFDGTQLPMGGTAYVYFDADKEVSIPLLRYMYRVDVGQIEVDFDDESWMDRDVFVKNILLANVPNTGCLVKAYYTMSLMDSPGVVYGNTLTVSEDKPLFGNLPSGVQGYEGSNYSTTYYCWYAAGGSGTVPALLNLNVNQAKRVLSIDAEGALLAATVHSYDTEGEEGRVCSSTNPSQSHVLNVDKSFYAWFGCCTYGYYDILCPYHKQNAYPKLVIELSVDGTSYYYPIQMYYPQPNTVYSIDRITLKSGGSEYVNFYEKQFGMEMSMSVSPWTDVDISNINAGYADEHQTEIY